MTVEDVGLFLVYVAACAGRRRREHAKVVATWEWREDLVGVLAELERRGLAP